MIYLLLIGLSAGCLTLALAALSLSRAVRNHTNQLLGLQYDVGLLAIALDDVGISIHDDLRETAHLSRPGLVDHQADAEQD